MTSFQLFEAIGNIDDILIEEACNSMYKKSRRVILLVSTVACAMIIISIIVNQAVSRPYNVGNDEYSVAEKLPQETPVLKDEVQELYNDNIEINEINSLYSNAKFGGRLKVVSAKEWKKQYGIEAFLNNHNVEYLLSFSNDEKILYGVLNVELPDNNLQLRVSDRAMIDSSIDNLKTTVIGNVDVAICRIIAGDEGNYCAIYEGEKAVYTIEQSDISQEHFIMLLEELFEK